MATYHDAEDLARLLGKPKSSGNGWECICPAHDDSNPSLWVVDGGQGGRPRLHCRAGCDWEDIKAAIESRGLTWRAGRGDERRESRYAKADRRKEAKRRRAVTDIITPVPADAPSPLTVKIEGQTPTHVYIYRNAEGQFLRFVGRLDRTDGKNIRPFIYCSRADGGHAWAMGTPDEAYTLYGLEELSARASDPVLIVEGEKTADAARRLVKTHVVLTWQGGSNAIEKSDWSSLNARDVVIWPDADEAGRAAAEKILVKVAPTNNSVRIVDTSGLPAKWDLADPAPADFDVIAALGGSSQSFITSATTKSLTDYVITADQLVMMDLPQREYLITPFISTNSLNMIYAERGLGKTWFCLWLAMCLAKGDDFLDYLVERPVPVLYIDGEMPLADLQARVMAFDKNPPSTFMLLPSEILFREARPLNVHSKEDQAAIEAAIAALAEQSVGPFAVIFDNLSSLSGGIDENDNSALDGLLQWLLGLRHQGLAIVLVHHAGKNGTQRGASRREDLLDTSIALKRPDEDDEPHPGAHFILTFPKTRGLPPDPAEMELMLTENRGQLEWHYSEKRKIDPTIELLKFVWEKRPPSQKDLAELRGVGASRISQLCSKLRRRKMLEASPSLALTIEGKEALIAVFPEVEQSMLKQGELAYRDVL